MAVSAARKRPRLPTHTKDLQFGPWFRRNLNGPKHVKSMAKRNWQAPKPSIAHGCGWNKFSHSPWRIVETTCSTQESRTRSTSLCIDTTKTYEQHPGQETQCFASFQAKFGQYMRNKKQRFHCKLHGSGRNQCLTSTGSWEGVLPCFTMFYPACWMQSGHLESL